MSFVLGNEKIEIFPEIVSMLKNKNIEAEESVCKKHFPIRLS